MYTYILEDPNKRVHSSPIHDSSQLETIQVSINSRMNKLWLIHIEEYYIANDNFMQYMGNSQKQC